LNGLKGALQKDGWDDLKSSLDVRLDGEQNYVAMAVDMAIAEKAEVFVGNGVSLLSSSLIPSLSSFYDYPWNHAKLMEHPPLFLTVLKPLLERGDATYGKRARSIYQSIFVIPHHCYLAMYGLGSLVIAAFPCLFDCLVARSVGLRIR
jgi:hypothetical protein